MAINSLRSNCPDETRDDVSVGWACDHDESCTTTAFSDSAWGAKRVSGSGGAADTRGGVWRTARKQSRYAAREQVTAHGNGLVYYRDEMEVSGRAGEVFGKQAGDCLKHG